MVVGSNCFSLGEMAVSKPRYQSLLVYIKRLIYTPQGRRNIIQFCLICCGMSLAILCFHLLVTNPKFHHNDEQLHYGNPRTLVIVIGSLRGGEVAWKTMYQHLLDANNADLALVIGENPDKVSSMYQRAKYLHEFKEYDDWAEALDQINGTSWRRTIYPYVNTTANPKKYWSFFLGGVGQIGGSGAIHFMARHYVQQLIKKENLLEKYDRFVVTRSDHYYMCKHDLSLYDNKYIWIPKHEDYFGICDRHVMANSSIIMKVLDVLPHLINNVDQYNPDLRRGWLKNMDPESFLKYYWRKRDILPWVRRSNRCQFTVKSSQDKTRGSTGVGRSIDKYIESFGLTIKYTPEFYATECNCEEGWAYSSANWKNQKRGWCLPRNFWTKTLYRVQ